MLLRKGGMAMSSNFVVSGSEKIPLPGATLVAPVQPDERVSVKLFLSKEACGLNEAKDKIKTFSAYYNLSVVSCVHRIFTLQGSALDVEKAFGVSLGQYE